MPRRPLSRGDHFRAALDVRGERPYVSNPDEVPGTWHALLEEASRWDGDIPISHELFAPASADRARKAVADFAGVAEVHLVVTARDLVRQLPAHWQENLKARSAESFGEFMSTVQADVRREKWFWLVQDYDGILERWGAGVPAERQHIVTLPPRGTSPAVLWGRFASLLGLDATSFDLDGSARNQSLGAEQTELLRRLNAALGQRLPRPGPYAPLVKGDLAELASQAEASRYSPRDTPSAEGILDSNTEVLIALLEHIHHQAERRKEVVGSLRTELRECRRDREAWRQQAARQSGPSWYRRLRRSRRSAAPPRR
jgi:hypothetical protein